MENSEKKEEYIAIPTEEQLPAYEIRQKSAFNYRALAAKGALIAAAILAVGALHKSFAPGNSMQSYDESYYSTPEPCMLANDEDYTEMKTFVEDLQESMGFGNDREARPFKDGKKKHKKHGKHRPPPPPHGGPHDGPHGCPHGFPPPPPHGGPHDGPHGFPPPPPHGGPHDGPHDFPPPPPHGGPHNGPHGFPPPPPHGGPHDGPHHPHFPPPPPHDGPDHPNFPSPPKEPKEPEEPEQPPKDDDKAETLSENAESNDMVSNIEQFNDEQFSPSGEVIMQNPDFDFKNDTKKFEPFCKLPELEAQSTVLSISPETFQATKFFLNGHFNRGGHVRLSKSSDASVKDIKVNVTVYAGQTELLSEAIVSAFEKEGDYFVQLERDHKHPPHFQPPPKPDHKHCLVYTIDVVFPQETTSYESFELNAEHTRIEGGEGIQEIDFGSIKAGLGHGAIFFEGLKAKSIKLAVLHGVVMGTYQPKEKFMAATVHGAIKTKIEPADETVKVVVSSTFGPASVELPAESYHGGFALFNAMGPASSIVAPEPEKVHVTKLKPGVKAGYYKENTDSHVIIDAKFHGAPAIYFN